MRVVKIEVSYGLTESMNYDNVKVQETRVAELDGSDDPSLCVERLMTHARMSVEEAIDDHLMRKDRPPRYYTGIRWGVWLQPSAKFIVLCPDEMKPGGWLDSILHGFPKEIALQKWANKVLIQVGSIYDETLVYNEGESKEEWQARFDALVDQRAKVEDEAHWALPDSDEQTEDDEEWYEEEADCEEDEDDGPSF